MIAARSASLMLAQRAISSSVRPQPMQRRRAASSVQILVQGVCISRVESHLTIIGG
jgi:hypothetical protein